MNQYEIELRDKVALTAYEFMCRDNADKISGFIPQEQMVVFAYDSANLFMIEREKRDDVKIQETGRIVRGTECKR